MLLLGIDIGTSLIKAAVIRADDLSVVGSSQYPGKEMTIESPHIDWAEQVPEQWLHYTKKAIAALRKEGVRLQEVRAIGISYQMHGLVVVDKEEKVIRPSILWCDSRAVSIGEKAFEKIGRERCLEHLLNSPGNFTASKLGWIKENEPDAYDRIFRIMLPGDFISMQFTGELTTSIPALSEGIFWDFKKDDISDDILSIFQFDRSFIPNIQDVFSVHGKLKASIAKELGLPVGTPITYKAGDQPNNALSLNVLRPGEAATTAGTSGVIYSVTDKMISDSNSRVNTFAHVNYTKTAKRLGVLSCINGTGHLNRWIRESFCNGLGYEQMNQLASKVPAGSEGVAVLPFGNGAERLLENRNIRARMINIDLNRHSLGHIIRASQEGIAYAFRYGMDIMKENGIHLSVIRAGAANMFMSPVFRESFVNVTGIPLELYENNGCVGAAIGAGIGCGIFIDFNDAFKTFVPAMTIEPAESNIEESYFHWKHELEKTLEK